VSGFLLAMSMMWHYWKLTLHVACLIGQIPTPGEPNWDASSLLYRTQCQNCQETLTAVMVGEKIEAENI
jgi:hypothetical protein